MHKSHFMSQTKIALPISLEYLERPGELVPTRELVAASPGDQIYKFRARPDRQMDGPFDPWALREQFLSWPSENWGMFVEMAGDFGGFGLSQNSFAEWQQLLREALVRPAREWNTLHATFSPQKANRLLGSLPLKFDWSGTGPTARVQTKATLDAMIASIQVDKLQGAEFRVCARLDCKKPPFKVGTRQKIYCDSDCAHLVAVRNSRTRAATATRPRRTELQKTRTKGGKK